MAGPRSEKSRKCTLKRNLRSAPMEKKLEGQEAELKAKLQQLKSQRKALKEDMKKFKRELKELKDSAIKYVSRP